MSWLLIVVTVWMAVAVPLAVLLGRAVRLADRREAVLSRRAVPDYVPHDWVTSTTGTR